MDFGVIFNNTGGALLNAEALYLALAAIGLNIHFGYTGLLNFGQVGFLAVAAYGLGVGRHLPRLPVLRARSCSGWVLAVLLALLLGIPTLRLRADYLAIVTIASSEVLRLIARSARCATSRAGSSGLTGFANGFYYLNPLSDGSLRLRALRLHREPLVSAAGGWTLVVLGSLLVFLLMRSPWGRVLKAIPRGRGTPCAASARTSSATKMQSLILGGIFGALGGFIFAWPTARSSRTTTGTLLTFFAFTA
jgi:branched-chain amino acid transport system permease protein